MAVLDYRPANGGYEVHAVSPNGLELVVRSDGSVPEGSDELRGNIAFLTSTMAFGESEFGFRRARSPEKRESLRKAAEGHARTAQALADLIDRLGDQAVMGWCSGCFEHTSHRFVVGHGRPKRKHLCANCGTPTVVCAVPGCDNHAVMKPRAVVTLCYCAPHHHQIPSFEKLTARLETLEGAEGWLAFEHRNAARVTKVAGGGLGAALVLAPAAFFAAPVVGAALGSSALGGGLTGAAATSHGLAMLGGGSIAAGGLGMAGGTVVVTATGSAVGGLLGGNLASAYASSDRSFRIQKLRDGTGPAVLLASGFLTEKDNGWGPWQKMVDARYPDAPVYRVFWGSKELKDLGILGAAGAGGVAARRALVRAGARGSKSFGSLPGIGWLLAAHDVAANPWTVAKTRAAMTGTVLADLIARTNEGPYVLIGHSLGARVMVHAAQSLGSTDTGAPRIEAMHLLGAAVGTKGDWRTLNEAVSGTVWNYYSGRDQVLKTLYAVAELGQKAVGLVGFNSKFDRIKDRNVTRKVDGHSRYLGAVTLS